MAVAGVLLAAVSSDGRGARRTRRAELARVPGTANRLPPSASRVPGGTAVGIAPPRRHAHAPYADDLDVFAPRLSQLLPPWRRPAGGARSAVVARAGRAAAVLRASDQSRTRARARCAMPSSHSDCRPAPSRMPEIDVSRVTESDRAVRRRCCSGLAHHPAADIRTHYAQGHGLVSEHCGFCLCRGRGDLPALRHPHHGCSSARSRASVLHEFPPCSRMLPRARAHRSARAAARGTHTARRTAAEWLAALLASCAVEIASPACCTSRAALHHGDFHVLFALERLQAARAARARVARRDAESRVCCARRRRTHHPREFP